MATPVSSLTNTNLDFKEGDFIVVDVETSAGSGVWETKKLSRANLFRLSGRLIKVTIASAQVLTSNASPVTLVPAPGSGLALACEWAAFKMTYNSIAYTAFTRNEIYASGATHEQFFIEGALSNTADTWVKMRNNDTETDNEQFRENVPLVFSTQGGNPLLGNSDVDIYLKYEIFDV